MSATSAIRNNCPPATGGSPAERATASPLDCRQAKRGRWAMTDKDARRSMDQRLEGLTPTQRSLLMRRLMERRTDAAHRNAIPQREDDGPAPLSFAQELLWLLSQVFDDGIAYNAPGSFQLEGSFDLELLARALEALVERHSILRTQYALIGGTPMQSIGPVLPGKLHLIDLR